jgi:hypothetical protein
LNHGNCHEEAPAGSSCKYTELVSATSSLKKVQDKTDMQLAQKPSSRERVHKLVLQKEQITIEKEKQKQEEPGGALQAEQQNKLELVSFQINASIETS